MTKDVSGKAECEDMGKLESSMVDLRSKVAGELTGGR